MLNNEQIGDYKIIEFISNMPDAEVFLASSIMDPDLYAITRYSSEIMAKKEFNIISTINPRYCIRPVSVIGNCFVTKYCEQRSLSKLCGYLDEEYAWVVLNRVASSLEDIHSKGYVHLCIKPQSLLLDKPGDVLLGGFIKAQPNNTEVEFKDRDCFDAPELNRQSPVATPPMDIWSLGACIFELLMGVPVFGGRGGLSQTESTPIPSFRKDKYSNELTTLIRSCLSYNPDNRPTASRICSVATEAVLNSRKCKHRRHLKPSYISCASEASSLDYWPERMQP